MDLLFRRGQTHAPFTLVPLQFGGGPVFKLWMRAELDEEELELLARYRLEDALLIADDWLAMFRRSFRTALLLGVVLWWVLFLFFSWSASTMLTLCAMLLFTFAYYNEIREHIYVRDLVHGRTFRCFSIIELIQKEEYLKGVSAYLRQVLQSAKHWDGQEVVPVPVLAPAEAKLMIAKSG